MAKFVVGLLAVATALGDKCIYSITRPWCAALNSTRVPIPFCLATVKAPSTHGARHSLGKFTLCSCVHVDEKPRSIMLTMTGKKMLECFELQQIGIQISRCGHSARGTGEGGPQLGSEAVRTFRAFSKLNRVIFHGQFALR